MNTASDQQDATRFWVLGALAVSLAVVAAFSYLRSMGYGIAASDLIGVKGREADVAYVQRWAVIWFTTAVCFLGVSGLSGALTTSIDGEAEWLLRFAARLIVASTVSFVLAALIGLVAVWIASHQVIL